MSHYVVPKNIIVGSNVLDEAQEQIKLFGKKALIVTGKHVVKSPMMKELQRLLLSCGTEYKVFDSITGEPTDLMIDQGVACYKNAECDFLIGIGGGSSLDSAKAIGAMVSNSGKIADYNGNEIKECVPKIVAIPTTAGTGSEATKFTIITDSKKGIKMLLKGDCLLPDLAIVDSEFTQSAPQSVTAATGLDALTHAIEAYTSKKAFSMTDTLAVSAVKRIMKYLPTAFEDGENQQARKELSIAALEAGICINNSSVTLVHGMSRPIGALFHVPHGMSNAMLLKECLTFAMQGAYKKFANLAIETGVASKEDKEDIAAGKFIDSVEDVCKICKIPTLQEYGIDKQEFYSQMEKMAQDAVDSGSPSNTVKPVTVSDCVEIYKRLYP